MWKKCYHIDWLRFLMNKIQCLRVDAIKLNEVRALNAFHMYISKKRKSYVCRVISFFFFDSKERFPLALSPIQNSVLIKFEFQVTHISRTWQMELVSREYSRFASIKVNTIQTENRSVWNVSAKKMFSSFHLLNSSLRFAIWNLYSCWLLVWIKYRRIITFTYIFVLVSIDKLISVENLMANCNFFFLFIELSILKSIKVQMTSAWRLLSIVAYEFIRKRILLFISNVEKMSILML